MRINVLKESHQPKGTQASKRSWQARKRKTGPFVMRLHKAKEKSGVESQFQGEREKRKRKGNQAPPSSPLTSVVRDTWPKSLRPKEKKRKRKKGDCFF